jgi:hypothetical protein
VTYRSLRSLREEARRAKVLANREEVQRVMVAECGHDMARCFLRGDSVAQIARLFGVHVDTVEKALRARVHLT